MPKKSAPDPTQRPEWLSPRERVSRAMTGKPVDRPPWGELVLGDDLISFWGETASVDHAARREFVDWLGLDLVCVEVSPDGTGLRELNQWAKSGDRFVFAVLKGGFNQGIQAVGFEAFLSEVARNRIGLHDHFLDAALRDLELARRALDHGADAIMVADDIAYNHGLIAPPDFFRDFYFPHLKVLLNPLSEEEGVVFFHTDGDLGELLPDLAAIGLRGLHGLEIAAGMDLPKTRSTVGNDLCLWGNLDPTHLTGGASRHNLTQLVEHNLRASQDGPFIFGTSSGLYEGMRLESLTWVSRTLKGSLAADYR